MTHALLGPLGIEVLCSLAELDLRRGVPIVFLNFFSHDTFCHHFGPDSPWTQRLLPHIDEKIESLLTLIDGSAQHTGVLFFSDHGQSPSRPFETAYGLSPQRLLRDLIPVLATSPGPSPRMLCSGNLAHIYFSDRHRLDHSEVEAHSPGITRVLSRHPGIGLVAATGDGGKLALARGANLVMLAPDAEPPPRLGLGPRGTTVAQKLAELVSHRHSGDLILFGDEVDGRLLSFLHQWGCHNGFLGEQSSAFVATSKNLDLDLPIHGLAKSVHQQLRRWSSR